MPHRRTHPFLIALLAIVGACSRGDGLEPIQAEQPLLELLAHPEWLTQVEVGAGEEFPQDLMKPRGSGSDDHGAYPALEMRAPGEVMWRVPKTYPDAVLRFALAVKRGGYQGRGKVQFEFELDGERVFEHELSSRDDLHRDDRRWYRFELPIGAGGELRVRVRYEGDQPQAPVVGVGLLRVVVPFEVERLPAAPDAPNVVLIVIDTLRADRLHTYGNALPVSPAMDALAARGTTFEQAFSAAAWTIPSTASILTGAAAPEHGLGFADSYYLSDSLVTIAEAFQRAGFTTGGFAGNPLIASSRNFAQGFEHFRDYSWPRGDDIAQDVGAWLDASTDKRFFLYLHYVDPHYPYEPPAELQQGIVGAPPADYLDREIDFYLPEFYADSAGDMARLLATKDHQLGLYDAEILGVDRAIEALLSKLRALDVLDNTIIAVTSDHGEEFLEHGWAGHHNQLYDESVRVPMIFAGPGVPAGKRAAWPVENRLVAPTLLALAGVDAPGNLAGTSLIGEALELGCWIDGDPGDAMQPVELTGRPVFFTNSKGRSADLEGREMIELGAVHGLIADGWRLIWSPTGPKAGGGEYVALYDLSRDPDCHRDLAAQEPERVQRMKDLIQRWIRDNQERSPRSLPSDSSTREMLIDIGYVSADD